MTHVESGQLHQRMIVPSIFPTSAKSQLYDQVVASERSDDSRDFVTAHSRARIY